MSAVWTYFKIDSPASKTAQCTVCKMSVSRGGTSVANYNTTNLIKHLKTKHAKDYAEFIDARNASKDATASKEKKDEPKQQTLEGALLSREKYGKDSLKATKITDKIMEFIILADQPLSIVENVGLRRLMGYVDPRYTLPGRKYISETALPKLFDEVKEYMSCQLKNVQSVSFTTDIWSSDVSALSLLSLTAHWVDTQSFTLRSAVLHASEFRGSHTGTSIAETMEGMLANWDIPISNVHAVLRDNASNMKKAMNEMGVSSLGCFAHSLQLVVNEGLLSQRSVSDALANGRRIVGHFKHSPLATTRLEDIQKQLQMPVKRLQQDVSTRWNSTLYMVQSLLEQKRAIASYAADYELPANLTANQWALLEKSTIVLSPFEELTKQISASTSTAAEVIPSVTVLKRLLSRETPEDAGIRTMKATLLEAVNTRFQATEKDPLYAVATLLDPRFKDRYFTSPESLQFAKTTLTQEVEERMEKSLRRTATEPAEKVPRVEAEPRASSSGESSLKGLFEEILQEHGEQGVAGTPAAEVQMNTFLAEKTIPRSESPFQYWKDHQFRFPGLATTAAAFLCAPSTSVDSERLFSAAANIIDEKRNRLGGQRAEMLIFLKKNLPLYLK